MIGGNIIATKYNIHIYNVDIIYIIILNYAESKESVNDYPPSYNMQGNMHIKDPIMFIFNHKNKHIKPNLLISSTP